MQFYQGLTVSSGRETAKPLSTVTSTSVAVGGVYGWIDWVDDWWLFRCVIRRFCVFEGYRVKYRNYFIINDKMNQSLVSFAGGLGIE